MIALPETSAKTTAKTTSNVFMAISPFSVMGNLPEQGKELRDSHHVLELFWRYGKK
jgi:hypothetical protein